MTKRQIALTKIRVEVAREGRMTREAMRAYIENRVSRQAFDEACRQGMAIFEKGAKFTLERDQKEHDEARKRAGLC